MRNVLIISQHFAPENHIASIRFTKMVKYLARTGEYHFWVICIGKKKDAIQDKLLQRDLEEAAEHVTVFPIVMDKKLLKRLKKLFAVGRKKRISSGQKEDSGSKKDIYYTIRKKYVTCREKGIAGSIKRFVGRMLLAVNDVYDLIFEASFARKGAALAKQIPMDRMDAMVTTYGHIGSFMLGLKFKRMKKGLRWIVDYRDAVVPVSRIQKLYLDSIVLKADAKADHITGATDSCFGSGRYLDKFHVITNGFDREDIQGFQPGAGKSKLEIAYTGSLYGGKRDMGILFQIIAELEAEGKVRSDKIAVLYAGAHFHILEDQAKIHGMTGILVNKGMLPREKALELQYQADILCVLSRSEEGYVNWLPGKTLECFMMERPVFSIITGTIAGSIVKRITEEAKLGYCYEEANAKRDYTEAKRWFLDRYMEFMQTGSVENHSEREILEQYSSENMTRRFQRLIEN